MHSGNCEIIKVSVSHIPQGISGLVALCSIIYWPLFIHPSSVYCTLAAYSNLCLLLSVECDLAFLPNLWIFTPLKDAKLSVPSYPWPKLFQMFRISHISPIYIAKRMCDLEIVNIYKVTVYSIYLVSCAWTVRKLIHLTFDFHPFLQLLLGSSLYNFTCKQNWCFLHFFFFLLFLE